MLEFEKTQQPRTSALEPKTMRKNGEMPKNQRSRGNFLRKTNIVLLAASIMICGLLFTGCGGDSPSSVVKKALNATIQKNADAVFKYYYNLSDYDKKSLRETIGRDHGDYDLVKFTIQDERIFDNGEKAEVVVKFLFKNGHETTTKLQLVKTGNGWKINR